MVTIHTVQSRAGYWQAWKAFKFVYDIILVALLNQGFLSVASTVEIAVLNAIVILFLVSSECELFSYNSERIKRGIKAHLL